MQLFKRATQCDPLVICLASFRSHARCTSSSANNPAPTITSNPLRFLSDLRTRVGKCINFGLSPSQIQDAGDICRILARDWRELLAGSEGFLTAKGRRGLHRHPVVWGEMVSQVWRW